MIRVVGALLALAIQAYVVWRYYGDDIRVWWRNRNQHIKAREEETRVLNRMWEGA